MQYSRQPTITIVTTSKNHTPNRQRDQSVGVTWWVQGGQMALQYCCTYEYSYNKPKYMHQFLFLE